MKRIPLELLACLACLAGLATMAGCAVSMFVLLFSGYSREPTFFGQVWATYQTSPGVLATVCLTIGVTLATFTLHQLYTQRPERLNEIEPGA